MGGMGDMGGALPCAAGVGIALTMLRRRRRSA
jgi:hypothetical protein